MSHKNDCMRCNNDHGPYPYVMNIEQKAISNSNFRTAVWTGEHLQMTLMRIPVGGEIGLEMHGDTDQLIRIEHGQAKVYMGSCKCELNIHSALSCGDAVFVPAGTWHNIYNTGMQPLSISSVYAPCNHPHGTVNVTARDAEH